MFGMIYSSLYSVLRDMSKNMIRLTVFFLAHCSSFIGGTRVNIESDGVYTYEPTCISYDSPTSRFAFLFRNDSSDNSKAAQNRGYCRLWIGGENL